MKNKKKNKSYFFTFLNLFWFGPAACGGWLVVVFGGWLFYMVVAITPITAISMQYIIIGAINISISSTR